jgi:SAM-dependent methyltransferase
MRGLWDQRDMGARMLVRFAPGKKIASPVRLLDARPLPTFPPMLEVQRVFFRTRLERAQFIAARLPQYIGGRVLDVGCDEAHLKALLSLSNYTGIDVCGRPDLLLNLEQIERLPFENGSFDCVICCEVLEHLDNLHLIFSELVRVGRRYLIISLPNNWGNARRPIERGTGSIGHYGLPLASPPDRHKWFFGLREAKQFLDAKAAENDFEVLERFATEKPRNRVVTALRHLRYPTGLAYLNRYAHTYWTVLAKRGSVPPTGNEIDLFARRRSA